MPGKFFVEQRGSSGWIVLGSAGRLWYNIVDTAQTAHVFGSNLQRGSGLGLLACIAQASGAITE
jgi:hypothetical protein